jgi:hypothetical protein
MLNLFLTELRITVVLQIFDGWCMYIMQVQKVIVKTYNIVFEAWTPYLYFRRKKKQ